MGFYTDDWTLRHEQTREGELYREKERLKEEKEAAEYRRRQEDYEREQAEYRAQESLRRERETRSEHVANAMCVIREKDEDIEHLKLCRKFGIEEGDKP